MKRNNRVTGLNGKISLVTWKNTIIQKLCQLPWPENLIVPLSSALRSMSPPDQVAKKIAEKLCNEFVKVNGTEKTAIFEEILAYGNHVKAKCNFCDV